MCVIPSGPDGPSRHWPNATGRLWLWRDQVAHQRRWPGEDGRTRGGGLRRGTATLAAASPLHPFSTDRIEAVCSRKTIYVRFDLNDYSIPPDAVGRPLTLVASDTTVRMLDGAVEIARHARTYDRNQRMLDPAHREALLKIKRKAFHGTPPAASSRPCRNPKRFWTWPSRKASQPAIRQASCSNCWMSTAQRLCATPSSKHSSATHPELARSPLLLRRQPRRQRWRSISAVIPKRKPSMFARTIWRPTMNSPAHKTMTTEQ